MRGMRGFAYDDDDDNDNDNSLELRAEGLELRVKNR